MIWKTMSHNFLLLSLLLLFCILAVNGGNNSINFLRDFSPDGYVAVQSMVSSCIGMCLNLFNQKGKPCFYDAATGQMQGGNCANMFTRPTSMNRRSICVYEKKDLEKGLTLESLVASKLCTTILVLVNLKYVRTGTSAATTVAELIITDPDFHAKAPEMAELPGVKMFYKLGTTSDQGESMSSSDFSKIFAMKGSRTKWVETLMTTCEKEDSAPYVGLYIRWLYPGCPKDDCTIGPASDEHMLVDSLKELTETWRSKFSTKKWELSMEISAKQQNIYMGLGIVKLSFYLNYFLILNFEWSEPKPPTGNKVKFQTPFSKNNESIHALLTKHDRKAYTNLKFFYGITTTMINYFLDKDKNRKQLGDDLIMLGEKSSYIPLSEACSRTMNKANNYIFNTTKNDDKTSYAKNETSFISYDEPNDNIEKVGRIFTTFSNRIGGIWMKDISNDDFTGKNCNCGTFPALRSANEGLYAGTCKMKNCFQPK